MFIFNQQPAKHLRRKLRNDATIPERRMWRCIRNSQLGIRFRRQVSIGRYVVDFFAFDRKLAIEIDGDTHADPARQGRERDRETYLRSHGIEVVRFTNREVLHNLEGCLEVLRAMVSGTPSKGK